MHGACFRVRKYGLPLLCAVESRRRSRSPTDSSDWRLRIPVQLDLDSRRQPPGYSPGVFASTAGSAGTGSACPCVELATASLAMDVLNMHAKNKTSDNAQMSSF